MKTLKYDYLPEQKTSCCEAKSMMFCSILVSSVTRNCWNSPLSDFSPLLALNMNSYELISSNQLALSLYINSPSLNMTKQKQHSTN